MGHHQAQEGGGRRQARQAVRQADQECRGRRAHRRRRSGREPDADDAIQKAKKSSVPNDNIDRAVRRGGSGAEAAPQYENITYEGYAPGGVAVLVECLTDNRNRAASDVRVAFSRNGGSMADPGSVSYLFHRKGVIVVEKKGVTEDDVLAAVLDAGAEEVNDLGESFEVVSEPADLVATRTALQDAGIDYDSADVAFLPSVEIDLDEDQARRVFRLIEALEDSDDVQDVYANYSVSTRSWRSSTDTRRRSPRPDPPAPSRRRPGRASRSGRPVLRPARARRATAGNRGPDRRGPVPRRFRRRPAGRRGRLPRHAAVAGGACRWPRGQRPGGARGPGPGHRPAADGRRAGDVAARGYPLSVPTRRRAPLYRSFGWELACLRQTAVIPVRSLRRCDLVPPDPAHPRDPGTSHPGRRGCGAPYPATPRRCSRSSAGSMRWPESSGPITGTWRRWTRGWPIRTFTPIFATTASWSTGGTTGTTPCSSTALRRSPRRPSVRSGPISARTRRSRTRCTRA